MEVRDTQPATYVFWGKFNPESTPSIHPLQAHCTDVACVFEALLAGGRMLAALQSTTSTRLTAKHQSRLAVLAFLHDLGKCNWGFQSKIEGAGSRTFGHVREAVALTDLLEIRGLWTPTWLALLQEMVLWFKDDAQLLPMLYASFSHHGKPVTPADDDTVLRTDRMMPKVWTPKGPIDPMAGVDLLCRAVRKVFPRAFEPGGAPIDASPALQHRFAGLVQISDWLGSDVSVFPYQANSYEDRAAFARKTAPVVLRAIGLAEPGTREVRDFSSIFPFTPSALQEQFNTELPLGDATQLVLAESDPGSGKTEAAFAWFKRSFEQGLVDGMYFALPTRVAAREIYKRVVAAVQAMQPDARRPLGPVLLAAPGYVQVRPVPGALPDVGLALWDEQATTFELLNWSAKHPKRFLSAPVVVGTVDQALMSVLETKHALLRSVCLDRHLLVVDEVHASDPYMREILTHLIRGHTSRGGRVLLLSATLGEVARSRFFKTPLLSLDEAKTRPYPAITTLAGEISVAHTQAAKTVRVSMLGSLEDAPLLERLAAALQAGARVLVICNTVKRANHLFRAALAHPRIGAERLFQVQGMACPHHGRFAREDREVMDQAITATLGKGTASRPLLLIGTQTLEQSLDIDADWLVSDFCPMDVFLQRVGRLHRHARPTRPQGFEAPQVLVRVPDGETFLPWIDAAGRRIFGQAGAGTVYPDMRILQRTVDVLKRHPVLQLPQDNRTLLEETTHPQALALLDDPRWIRHGQTVEGQALSQEIQGSLHVIGEKAFGDWHYDERESRVSSRLGSPSVETRFTKPVQSPFGATLTSLVIPWHMVDASLREQITHDSVKFAANALQADPLQDGDGFTFKSGPSLYRYSSSGLDVQHA